MSSLLARPGVRQLIKFCIVGVSSFIIDLAVFSVLHFKIGLSFAISTSISFVIAVTNGFFWNSRWTFKDRPGDAKTQYPKFLATNAIGWFLNLTIATTTIVIAMRSGLMHSSKSVGEIVSILANGQGKSEFKPIVLIGSKIVATAVVMLWNFTAARFWTFRPTKNT